MLALPLNDAIDRGLKYNLGLLLSEQGTREARGARLRALSDLLPKVSWETSESRQQINLQAFGFSSFPGIPSIVGPFNVFDTRAYFSQPILDFKAINGARTEAENLKAAEFSYQDSRDLVVLVCADLYLAANAASSRVDAAAAELKTAQAIYDRAVDLKKAGTVPAIDVLRAQVELQAEQQRLMFVQNAFLKQKLSLARAIGLPTGQEFALSDKIPYAPAPPLPLDQALELALKSRSDFQSAVALVRAAESNKKAARGEGLPALRFNADYGDIGLSPGNSHGTFTVAANVRVPIFQGGLVRGKVLEAEALLRQRQAQLEDLRSRIDFEVRTAYMDLKSSGDQVQVAMSAEDLATEQVKQAQDRFAAGVANSLEVVQAQEALATADENYISSLFGFNVAKATLARSMGQVENAAKQLLGGKR
ncbi:MAG TPA: TolC family protein [Terriglobia bacterium]|nr:TolC family protein [Terriglobia bacterium]